MFMATIKHFHTNLVQIGYYYTRTDIEQYLHTIVISGTGGEQPNDVLKDTEDIIFRF